MRRVDLEVELVAVADSRMFGEMLSVGIYCKRVGFRLKQIRGGKLSLVMHVQHSQKLTLYLSERG